VGATTKSTDTPRRVGDFASDKSSLFFSCDGIDGTDGIDGIDGTDGLDGLGGFSACASGESADIKNSGHCERTTITALFCGA
jgi:hypothetical protein